MSNKDLESLCPKGSDRPDRMLYSQLPEEPVTGQGTGLTLSICSLDLGTSVEAEHHAKRGRLAPGLQQPQFLLRKSSDTLGQAAQGMGRVTIPGGAQETCTCSTEGMWSVSMVQMHWGWTW